MVPAAPSTLRSARITVTGPPTVRPILPSDEWTITVIPGCRPRSDNSRRNDSKVFGSDMALLSQFTQRCGEQTPRASGNLGLFFAAVLARSLILFEITATEMSLAIG
jgi:hypothetical protein